MAIDEGANRAYRNDEYRSDTLNNLHESIDSASKRQSEALRQEADDYLEQQKRLTERGVEDELVSGAERYARKLHPVRTFIRKQFRRFGALFCNTITGVCFVGFIWNALRLAGTSFLLHPSWSRPTPLMLLWLIPPILVLLFGNLSEDFNYYRPKKWAFITLSGHFIVSVLRCAYALSFTVGMHFWAWLPVHELLPARFIWFFAMYWILFPVLLIGVELVSFFVRTLFKDLSWLYNFRFANTFDVRPERKTAYDARFIHLVDKDKVFPIYETDRFLHTLIVGATGTGKSALAGEGLLKDDIEKRVENDVLLRKALEKMVEERHATMIRRLASEDDWSPSDVKPEPGYEDEYAYYLLTYRSCGITLVAPDASLADKIYSMSKRLHLKVNRIEPCLLPDGSRAEGWTGFNPLYISPTIPSWMLKDEIVRRATLVADVIGAINEGTGSDEYFKTVNRSMTICILVELMYAFPFVNRDPERTCPTLFDFDYILSDFSRIAQYNDAVRENDTQRTFRPYTDFVSKDMLAGYSNEKARNDKSGLWSQSRGLRNNVRGLLGNRQFREILCSPTTMDIDRALADGEITLVDYAYSNGDKDAAMFAGFFIRCFFDSVYRRPGTEQSRLPHFFLNDEASITLETVGPAYERAAVLFRKYRVGMTLMIQSLQQLDKTKETAYSKGVLLSSCSTQIIFGRISPEEMKMYSELSGTKDVTKEQKTLTQTALTVENPTASIGTREMVTEEEVLKGTAVRYRTFTEFTVFSVRNGTPLFPFVGRSTFRKPQKDKQIKRYVSHFVQLSGDAPLPAAPAVQKEVEEKAAVAVKEQSFTAAALIKKEEYQSLRPFSLTSFGSDDACMDDSDAFMDEDEQSVTQPASAPYSAKYEERATAGNNNGYNDASEILYD